MTVNRYTKVVEVTAIVLALFAILLLFRHSPSNDDALAAAKARAAAHAEVSAKLRHAVDSVSAQLTQTERQRRAAVAASLRMENHLQEIIDSAWATARDTAATLPDLRDALTMTLVTVEAYRDTVRMERIKRDLDRTMAGVVIDSLKALTVAQTEEIADLYHLADLAEKKNACTIWLIGECPSRKASAAIGVVATVITWIVLNAP